MKQVPAILSAIIVVAVALGAWFLLKDGVPLGFGEIRPSKLNSGTGSYEGPPLSADYTNSIYGFSLDTPEGFTVGELPKDENGAQTILIQNTAGEGIQIFITPFPDDRRVLTEADIRADIPDMQIRNVENVEIGPDHLGVAFLSDNEAFGGDSREVWFVYRGNLYQISTYTRLDSLLQAMFSTWKFF
jgi:hypothetical protein